MTLQNLQDQLRAHIRARIRRGEMTGSDLAREAEFPQGHLSNFLNARRGLSLESMDRLLDTLGIGVLDLVDAKDIQQRAVLPEAAAGIERVALVSPKNAGLARFAPHQILETRSFNRSFLRKLKSRSVEDRRDWLRFVLIKLDGKGARLLPFGRSSVTLLLDRHYNSLQPYRRLRPNVYAVSFGGRCVMGHVSVLNEYLVLRPRDPQQEVEMLRIERGKSYSDYIVGRVCHVGLEV